MAFQPYLRSVSLSSPLEERSYLTDIPAVQYLEHGNALTFEQPVTFFVGENGTGKSTLMEAIAIACGFNPEGGSRNFQFHTADTHATLYRSLNLVKNGYPEDWFFLRAESFYNVASYIDTVGVNQSYGGVSLHEQSHGESFLTLMRNRFRGKGLYLLDEPEAALSPMHMLTLLAEIDALVHQNSQFLIATHSPILMAYPKAKIYALSETGVHVVQYQDTEHYQITKEFLEHPEQMLHYLLAED